MRNVILSMSVSLDGFIEGPNREIDWHLVDEELHLYFNRQSAAASGFLSGRVTHELMAGFWPTADQDPESSPATVEFSRIWREKPKIVYSRTLDHADWNTTIVPEVRREDVMALKAQPGGDLSLGGADLTDTFRRLDLIDEYQLFVNPIVLGKGKPLFQPLDTSVNLRLVENRVFDTGVVLLRYRRLEA